MIGQKEIAEAAWEYAASNPCESNIDAFKAGVQWIEAQERKQMSKSMEIAPLIYLYEYKDIHHK